MLNLDLCQQILSPETIVFWVDLAAQLMKLLLKSYDIFGLEMNACFSPHSHCVNLLGECPPHFIIVVNSQGLYVLPVCGIIFDAASYHLYLLGSGAHILVCLEAALDGAKPRAF